MHIVVTAVGSAGDINPMLMIACELSSRGHEVEFIANEYFKEKVEKAGGLGFHALGGKDLYLEAVGDPDLWNPRKSFEAVWRTLKDSLKMNVELIEACLRPESILMGSTVAFGTRLVQELHGNKCATVHLAPSCIISGREPMAMPGMSFFPSVPHPVRELFMSSIDRMWLDGVCRADLNSVRKDYDLPPVKSVMRRWMHSPDMVICAFPSWYAAPQSDWPPNIVMTGFPVYDRPEDQQLEDRLEHFLNSGAPPVVFTAGSAMAQAREHFETAIEAAQIANMRAVLVSAFPEQIPARLPDNICYARYAPFSVLFPRAAVTQHHGGIGTSAQSLRAGVPQMVTPFAHDQFDNAHRLEKLGVAKEMNKYNASSWAKALKELANSAEVRSSCDRIKAEMASAPFASQTIADAVEKLGAE